jgi:hypothetical protein
VTLNQRVQVRARCAHQPNQALQHNASARTLRLGGELRSLFVIRAGPLAICSKSGGMASRYRLPRITTEPVGVRYHFRDHIKKGKNAAEGEAKVVTGALVECCAWDRWPPRFLIHDRDGRYGALFERRLRHLGIAQVRTPFRAPRANAISQRWVKSVRTEYRSPVHLHRGPFASSHFVVCHIFQLLASA